MSKDHVAIPKLIMKNFCVKKGIVSYIDFSRQVVRDKSINILGTKENYYSRIAENSILANRVELEFGKFLERFFKADSVDAELRVIHNHYDQIVDFIKFATARTAFALDAYNKDGILAQTLGPISHSDYLIIVDRIPELNLAKYLSNNNIKIILYSIPPNSGRTFITSFSGYFMGKVQGASCICLPLSPYKMLSFQDATKSLGYHGYYDMDDDEVENVNKHVVMSEMTYGNNFVIGYRNELDALLPYIQSRLLFKRNVDNISISQEPTDKATKIFIFDGDNLMANGIVEIKTKCAITHLSLHSKSYEDAKLIFAKVFAHFNNEQFYLCKNCCIVVDKNESGLIEIALRNRFIIDSEVFSDYLNCSAIVLLHEFEKIGERLSM